MALAVTPSKVSQSTDCLSLVIMDSTGAYNASSKPGGYGSPNPVYTDIDLIILRVYLPEETTVFTDITLTTITTPTAIQYANPVGGYTYTLTSINTGQSATTVAIADGAMLIEQYVCYLYYDIEADCPLDVTNGSTTVLNFGGGSLIQIIGFTHILISGVMYGFTYVSPTQITLDTPYEGATGVIDEETYYAACMGSVYSMNYCNATSCMKGLLGAEFVTAVTEECGECFDNAETLAEQAFYQNWILIANESCNDNESFQRNVTTYNEKFCDGTSTNCGCS